MKRRARYAAMLVGCVGLAATLSAAGAGFEPRGDGRAAVLEDQRVQLFSLNEIIEPAASDPLRAPVVTPVASVLTVVEAALAAASEEGDPPARVTFHDESGLLILRAEDPEIEAVREALELIREDIRRVREDVANQDRTLRTGIVETVVDIHPARRAELEAQLKMAMIAIERAQLEMQRRQDMLAESERLAETGMAGKIELRERRSALEHARLAMHEAEVQADSRRQQLEAVSQGPEAMGRMRMAQAEGELRMALIAVDRAQVEFVSWKDALDEVKQLGEKEFVTEGEVRERRVAMEHARLSLEQAKVMVEQMRARVEAAQELPAAEQIGAEDQALRSQMEELANKRSMMLHQYLAEIRLRAQGDDGSEADALNRELATTDQRIALLESRLAEANAGMAAKDKRRADEMAVRGELDRRIEQLARLEAVFGEARDREAATSREMIEHTTRLEVRLEETQRVLERKHVECADLAVRLREMMVRVEVEAARRNAMEEEIHRLRKALEECRGKE